MHQVANHLRPNLLGDHVPASGANRAIEELDYAQQHPLGAGGDLAVNDLVQQELLNVGLGHLIGRLLAKVRQFSNRSHVSVDGPLGLAGQLQVFDQFPVPFSFEMIPGQW